MKLKIGILIFLSVIGMEGFSQINSFNLANYKLPDVEWRSLETNFGVLSTNKNYSSQIANTSEKNQNSSNQFYGSFYSKYYHFLNNEHFQRSTSFNFNLSSNFFKKKKDNKVTYKNNSLYPSFYYNRVNRRYLNKKYFLETNINANYYINTEKVYSNDIFINSKYSYNSLSQGGSTKVPIKFGMGRIEPVQDARQAVYILDELSKVNRTSTDKSDEEIIEFANLISKLKNKRYFDSRLRRIAEIESLDSFLLAKNEITKKDAKYFTTLTDFWDYGSKPLRGSGTRISVAIQPEFNFQYANRQGDDSIVSTIESNLTALNLYGGLEFNYEKPINLKWQNSIELKLYAGNIEGKRNDIYKSEETKIKIPNIQMALNQTIGFYPSTRTSMSLGYSIKYFQFFDKEDASQGIVGLDGKAANMTGNLSINYYISPKFRLNASSSLYYLWQNSKNNVAFDFDNMLSNYYLSSNFNGFNFVKVNEISNNLSISLIYSLF